MTRLLDLVLVSREVASTRSRTEKTERLARLLRSLAGPEIPIGVAFLSGRLRQGRIGLGPALVRAAMGGSHAAEPSLSLADVDEAFERIGRTSGAGSGAARAAELSRLFARATREEADFLTRLIVGELRQGALAGVMEDALARATGIPIEAIRRAVMVAGDPEPVAVAALTEGAAGLEPFRVALFRPLAPMLAQTSDEAAEAIARLGEAALEYKLDGARVQIHKSGEQVRVYSRRLHDVTAAVPEIVEAAAGLGPRELILDGEALALKDDGMPHPFQVTMRRLGRRLDVHRMRSELPLTLFAFDLLRLEDEDLLDAPARRRFEVLRRVAPAMAVPQRLVSDPMAAAAFLEEALRAGHEGLMAKGLDQPYEAGRRGGSWLKIKPAHTLDLVVLAAEWGHGRRAGWLSNLHLGARDPATGGFVMLGKTFKGMTDAQLAWQTARFQELAIGSDGYTVHLRPEQVVEIAFNDVQESPHYPAGLALRFARVKRYRDDKTADEVDTIETVRAIHLRERAGRDARARAPA